MAEVGVPAQLGPPVTNKNIGTVRTHGLDTPENTPPPDEARNEAENARQLAETKNVDAQQKKTSPEPPPSPKDGSPPSPKDGSPPSPKDGSPPSPKDGSPPSPKDESPPNPKGGSEGDEMEVEKTTPKPERTQWHLKAYESFTQMLGILLNQAENNALINTLDAINDSIREYNTKHGFSQDQFVVDYSTYIAAFKEAVPYRASLKTKPDEEAKGKLESINKRLEKYNKEHDYPSYWVIEIPEPIPEPPAPQRKVTPRRERASERTAGQGRSINSRTRTGWMPKALTINERDGYVFYGGVEKEIAGHVPAGFGHRLLLRQDGRNDYDIYELVRASKFGKNFMDRNKDVLEGKEMNVGTKKSLVGKSFKNVQIYGVAPVRTDSDDEAMLMAWLQFPKDQPLWYWRGWLGDEFGLDKVDEVLNRYVKKAGQKLRRFAQSISLREEDTTDEDGEVEDTEDSEDDGDLDDEAKLHILMKEVENLQKRLKNSGKKSSASSRKPKSKRAK
jgi:hypothetical protein